MHTYPPSHQHYLQRSSRPRQPLHMVSSKGKTFRDLNKYFLWNGCKDSSFWSKAELLQESVGQVWESMGCWPVSTQYIRSAGQCKPNRASLRSCSFEVWGRSPGSPKEGAVEVKTTTINLGRIRWLDVFPWDAAGISVERLFAAALKVLISFLSLK